jgi:AraC-like DNA-binding protein
MSGKNIIKVKTISEFHALFGLPKPEHPLISLVDYSSIRLTPENEHISWAMDFYSISVKRAPHTTFKYGQQVYDFDEGVMFFIAPGQTISVTLDASLTSEHSGWMLLIHPDFLWGTPLAGAIKNYDYFDYSLNEALFLSHKEELILGSVIQNIKHEYHSNIDRYSQGIIISQIETLLNYSERFYQRQFITRKVSSHQIVTRLEALLEQHFRDDDALRSGLPTVNSLAEKLNISASYLSTLLKTVTGQNTQQHIHDKLIKKAKEKLSTTTLSVSEIANALGFEHPQSFSKLFRAKTSLSPHEFRRSLN